MADAAEAAAKRGVKSMLVRPAPYARYQKYVTHLIDSGYFGELRQVMAYCIMPTFARRDTPREYRQTHAGLGPYNAMQLGLQWTSWLPGWDAPSGCSPTAIRSSLNGQRQRVGPLSPLRNR